MNIVSSSVRAIDKLGEFVSIHADCVQTIRLLIRVYPKYSFKRKVAFVLELLFGYTIQRFNSNKSELQAWIKRRCLYQKNSIFAALLHKKAQNGRVYIFEFDQSYNPVSFTKLSNEATSNHRIEKEMAVLRNLTGRTTNFKTPCILNFAHEGTSVELCVKAADASFAIHPKADGLPESIFNEISGLGTLGSGAKLLVSNCDWFPPAAESVGNPRLKKIINSILSNQAFDFSAAHCDLGSENILSRTAANSTEKEYLILDWEFFADQAPALTDRVSYWLGQKHRVLKRSFPRTDPNSILSLLIAEFENRGHSAQEVAMALLYLVHIGHDLSAIVSGVQHDCL